MRMKKKLEVMYKRKKSIVEFSIEEFDDQVTCRIPQIAC
jgi:hypothetical protein